VSLIFWHCLNWSCHNARDIVVHDYLRFSFASTLGQVELIWGLLYLLCASILIKWVLDLWQLLERIGCLIHGLVDIILVRAFGRLVLQIEVSTLSLLLLLHQLGLCWRRFGSSFCLGTHWNVSVSCCDLEVSAAVRALLHALRVKRWLGSLRHEAVFPHCRVVCYCGAGFLLLDSCLFHLLRLLRLKRTFVPGFKLVGHRLHAPYHIDELLLFLQELGLFLSWALDMRLHLIINLLSQGWSLSTSLAIFVDWCVWAVIDWDDHVSWEVHRLLSFACGLLLNLLFFNGFIFVSNLKHRLWSRKSLRWRTEMFFFWVTLFFNWSFRRRLYLLGLWSFLLPSLLRRIHRLPWLQGLSFLAAPQMDFKPVG